MFYHLKIFLRNLRRNYTYSGINIAGLSIGITASVLIFLWVHHERSFDNCYPDTGRIYRIINTIKFGENINTKANVPFPFILTCENEIPEIESAAYLFISPPFNAVTVNNTTFSVNWGDGVFVNKVWLEMFHSQILDGSFEAYGNHPFSVALTESGAKKYFGNEQATGQIVRINDADYTLQAVVRDNPTNSSFRYHIMASTDAAMSDPNYRQNLEQWGWVNWKAFVKLRPDADVSQVSQKMNDILAKNIDILAKNNNITNFEMRSRLELLTDMYFSDVEGFIRGNAKMVSIFTLLGILLLCIACINYINLTTARVTLRSKEVGVKKIVGAKRLTLFFQFIIESFIICFIATLIALYLILILSPQYQSLIGSIAVSFSSPVIWIITGITLLFATLLNGIYPAFMLSSFQPLSILKGISFSKIKNSSLRKVLVVFQFTLSAVLIISVIVIFKQTQFILNTDPGFRRDDIVRFSLPFRALMSSGQENAALSLKTIKGKLQSYPDVVGVSLNSNGNIESIGSSIGWRNADWDGRSGDAYPDMSWLLVDEDFMDVFELQLKAGRWFAGGTDMQNVILNETAIREYGIPEPYIGQRFDVMGNKGNIIGIVKDFHFKNRHEKITPLLIQPRATCNILAIKTQDGKSAEVIHEMKTIWSEFFPNDPFEYTFVEDAFNNLYRSDIRTSRLILTFSILAVVIAMLGLFGLSTFAIERRTKEIGIRKVLGASVADIVSLLTREFFILVAIAFVIAAPVAWWVMNRWLENFAYRIDITVWIFVAGAAITTLIALTAIGIQSVKAATDNPLKAIKME